MLLCEQILIFHCSIGINDIFIPIEYIIIRFESLCRPEIAAGIQWKELKVP